VGPVLRSRRDQRGNAHPGRGATAGLEHRLGDLERPFARNTIRCSTGAQDRDRPGSARGRSRRVVPHVAPRTCVALVGGCASCVAARRHLVAGAHCGRSRPCAAGNGQCHFLGTGIPQRVSRRSRRLQFAHRAQASSVGLVRAARAAIALLVGRYLQASARQAGITRGLARAMSICARGRELPAHR
jgi:hypothetical protein